MNLKIIPHMIWDRFLIIFWQADDSEHLAKEKACT
jgi:hypothetical protein|tara:strand:- start:1453 stop:1557 length:105 start_codon:yes stop_codon:yes gene_type:complete